MNVHITFEYYSTFAPVAGAFLADEPTEPINPFRLSQSLKSIDRGYTIYSEKTTSRSSQMLHRK